MTLISRHHRRTAIIAKHIGEFLKLKQDELEILIYSALLHDIGAASNWNEKHFIAYCEDDLIFNHAEKGYLILKDSYPLGILAEPIRYHHDRYYGGNPSGLKGEDIPLISRIIHISDRIEVLINNDVHILFQRCNIIQVIKESNYFDPKLVQVFNELSKFEYFWLDIVNPIYQNHFLDDISFFGKLLFDIDDLIDMAEIFAKVVDETSHYTAEHSKNVAKISKFLAEKRGFSNLECKQFYLAGLLHDLGKLAIPSEILNKPYSLTKEEFDLIRQHPYYSHSILEHVEGFEKIAVWAGTHHETLDEKGYPYKLKGSDIDLGSHIIAVADVFSSLIEDRPYRKGMSLIEAFDIIEDMVKNLKLDVNVVKEAKKNQNAIFKLIKK